MSDVIITGASRGIGRALALALAGGPSRLVLVARDAARLAEVGGEVRARGGEAVEVSGDLGSRAAAQDLGERLVDRVAPGSTLVHNAGLWPARRRVGDDGLEESFVINHLGPWVMQRPLLAAGRLSRIMVIGAGLMVRGRFDAEATPTGEDFSPVRTYSTTKLCFAVAMRELGRSHPELDVVVLHPGVVRTDLGARPGPLGWLLALVKRRWEHPDDCAARLAQLLARPRWSEPGDPRWMVESQEQPWPAVACDPSTVEAVLGVTQRLAPP